MRYYETLYIINPNYELERLDAVTKAVGDVLEKAEGVTVINHRIWGKKRLAYPIEKHKYGTYVLLQFELDTPAFLTDLDQFLKLEKAIIRHQTIRLESRPEVYVEAVEESATESTEASEEETPVEKEEPAVETESDSETNEDASEAESSASEDEKE